MRSIGSERQRRGCIAFSFKVRGGVSYFILVMHVPLHSNGQFPRSRARLNNNVALLHTRLEKLGLGTGNKRLNDGRIPSGVDNGDAQRRAVVLLGSGTLE